MREIKFRAWDKVNKWMWVVDSICWRAGRILHIRGLANYHGLKDAPIGCHANYANIDNILLMQFTGLKDKNGKEIYEGDIVKRPKGTVHEVFWVGDRWGLKGGGCWLGAEAHTYEIIGNIHENPELVKEEKS